jgi:hypothetical protein
MEISNFEPTTVIGKFLAGAGIQAYKDYRRKNILEALEKGDILVDSSTVKNEGFISAYLATEQALMKASSTYKFNLLIDLFINGSNSGRIEREPDAYQEALSIVDELSERELIILYHLYIYEIQNGEMEGQLSRENFHQIEYLAEKTSLKNELIVALLVRLRRTGLLITYTEKSGTMDLMMSAVEIMFISPIADEIKSWVFNVIEGSYR